MDCFVGRPGARFAPKAKPKQQPRKNVSASKNNVDVASSTTLKESEGISQVESHNAVAVSSSIEEPIKSDHRPDISPKNGELCFHIIIGLFELLFSI